MKHIWTLFLVLSTIVCGACPKTVNGARISLGDGWTLSRDGGAEHCTASVPSTVAGALDAAGFWGAEGLMEGRRYETADKSLFDGPWTYTKVFSAKPSKKQHSSLIFEGLNYRADIFLNGKQIAASDTTYGVFCRREYDVTKLLKRRNRLEVKLQRAQSGDLNIGFVDWNPRPLDESMGIIRPVCLHTTGAVSIEDVFVVPKLDLKEFSMADLSVRAGTQS